MAHAPKSKSSTKLAKSALKEVSYSTKQVDSSLVLLDSPEDNLVLDALLYVSKYADLSENNLRYLQQRGLLQKLLNLLERNVCILRLVMRLLGVLFTNDDVVEELNQEIYDGQIVKIANMYIKHNDPEVREFCISALSKLTGSCRITCLIFKIELFHPILDTIKKTTDNLLLEWTLELFLKLLNAPAAIDILPEMYRFDMSILMKHLESTENRIAHWSFEIIQKLTYYCLEVFQKMFRSAKVVEKMLEIVMNEQKQEFHDKALDIIFNCLKSEETTDYFVESLEFLRYCQWVKTCDAKYLYPSIVLLEHLTNIPKRRQILFDFSVEDSILSFLRSKDKKVLNKTCQAISNMTTHKYCCEHMLTPVLLKELFHILIRKDEEDPGNEVALKTIFDFSRRNLSTLDMIHNLGVHKILLGYFKRGTGFICEESFLQLLEILYKMSMHPLHQQDIITASFFERLLHLFSEAPTGTATFACEILTNFVHSTDFRRIFLSLGGPEAFLQALQSTTNVKLQRNILLFIHSNLGYENMVRSFLEHNLVKILKELPESFKFKAPIAEKVLRLVYDSHLPLKFFVKHRLELTDKLLDKFYIINGAWKEDFPFLEQLEACPVSTAFTVYVVDYAFDILKDTASATSDSICMSPKISGDERSLSTLSRVSSSISSYFRRRRYQVKYGKLSADPFLQEHAHHAKIYIDKKDTIEEKVKVLAEYINSLLCGAAKGDVKMDKIHSIKYHVATLKHKLGSNLIPIGFLKLGSYCERALCFKAIADRCGVPASLVKGPKLYWNEVAVLDPKPKDSLRLHVVDLINNIGDLLPVGSRDANQYCDLKE